MTIPCCGTWTELHDTTVNIYTVETTLWIHFRPMTWLQLCMSYDCHKDTYRNFNPCIDGMSGSVSYSSITSGMRDIVG